LIFFYKIGRCRFYKRLQPAALIAERGAFGAEHKDVSDRSNNTELVFSREAAERFFIAGISRQRKN
jgi:hypothetical protein